MEDNDFTTDAILERLDGELAQHPEDDGPAPSQNNIRLLQHTEIAAFICLYREAGKLSVQMRIGYMFGTAASTRPRRNFRNFMMRPSHNPLRLLSGQSINLGECFVNDPVWTWTSMEVWFDRRWCWFWAVRGADWLLVDYQVQLKVASTEKLRFSMWFSFLTSLCSSLLDQSVPRC